MISMNRKKQNRTLWSSIFTSVCGGLVGSSKCNFCCMALAFICWQAMTQPGTVICCYRYQCQCYHYALKASSLKHISSQFCLIVIITISFKLFAHTCSTLPFSLIRNALGYYVLPFGLCSFFAINPRLHALSADAHPQDIINAFFQCWLILTFEVRALFQCNHDNETGWVFSLPGQDFYSRLYKCM